MSTDAHPEPLTKRQQEVLDFIRQNSALYGPTVREIAAGLQLASPNAVFCHIKALEKKGRIRRSPRRARCVEVLQ
jgi:repressor LexA